MLIPLCWAPTEERSPKLMLSVFEKKFLMCLCLSVRSDAKRGLSLSTDLYPHARATNLSHLSRVSSGDQRLQGRWLWVSRARGVLAPDCVTAFHFLLLYARRNKLSCCCLCSRKALQISHSKSSRNSFYYWTVQQPPGYFFSLQSQRQSPQFCHTRELEQGSCWIENFAEFR